jgi:hypothetical protein
VFQLLWRKGVCVTWIGGVCCLRGQIRRSKIIILKIRSKFLVATPGFMLFIVWLRRKEIAPAATVTVQRNVKGTCSKMSFSMTVIATEWRHLPPKKKTTNPVITAMLGDIPLPVITFRNCHMRFTSLFFPWGYTLSTHRVKYILGLHTAR